MTEIVPNLFLGSAEDALDPALTTGATVINVAREISKRSPYANRYVHLPIKDKASERIDVFFDRAFEIIDDELAHGRRVLVHCFAGISRSATIVIAYLMKKNSWTYQRAHEFVRILRPQVDPNFGFVVQLYTYQRDALNVEDERVSA